MDDALLHLEAPPDPPLPGRPDGAKIAFGTLASALTGELLHVTDFLRVVAPPLQMPPWSASELATAISDTGAEPPPKLAELHLILLQVGTAHAHHTFHDDSAVCSDDSAMNYTMTRRLIRRLITAARPRRRARARVVGGRRRIGDRLGAR